MKRYKDLGGKSGIDSFELGPRYITVWFSNRSAYVYNYIKPGRTNTEEMKKLALAGQGLNSYIGKYVGKKFYLKIA